MSEIDIINCVALVSKLGNIKQQKLYCFRTKKLTLLGAILVCLTLVQLSYKTIDIITEVY